MNENIVEKAALGWFEAQGYHTARGADISPGGENPLRERYEDVVLLPRLKAALRRLNPTLPEDAIVQAVNLVSRPPEPTLDQNNRWFHALITDGVPVEYRTPEGETRGDRASGPPRLKLGARTLIPVKNLEAWLLSRLESSQ